MTELSLRQMQVIELDMLLELDRVCREYGLRYYMDGGTLLGAVHYGGFIPWDDDIDLKMPRPDYEKLLTLQSAFPAHIRLDAPRREKCEYAFLKLVDTRTLLIEKQDNGREKRSGVYVDVFPMDGQPSQEAARTALWARMQKLNTRFHLAQDGFAALRASASALTRLKGLAYRFAYRPWPLYRRMTRTAMKTPYDGSAFAGLLTEGDPRRECFPAEWLGSGVTLPFEGHELPAPAGFAAHLRLFYGAHITDPAYRNNLPYIPPAHTHEVYLLGKDA